MQGKRGISQDRSLNARNSNINRHRLHVQTATSDPVSVCPQKLITPRRAVSTDNIHLGIWLAEFRRQVVDQVEDTGIIMMDITGPVIAQIVIELLERFRDVLITPTVHDIDSITRMGMVEP
jgi:hypothetical protein